MGLTDKIAATLARGFGWLLIRELRRIAVAVERGVDSEREMNGLRPLFTPAAEAKSPEAIAAELDGANGVEEVEIQGGPDGDFLRLEILEALAREHRVVVTSETDLVALGKKRGWLDEAGEIVMLPQGYGE